jgi:hypothetical protein
MGSKADLLFEKWERLSRATLKHWHQLLAGSIASYACVAWMSDKSNAIDIDTSLKEAH